MNRLFRAIATPGHREGGLAWPTPGSARNPARRPACSRVRRSAAHRWPMRQGPRFRTSPPSTVPLATMRRHVRCIDRPREAKQVTNELVAVPDRGDVRRADSLKQVHRPPRSKPPVALTCMAGLRRWMRLADWRLGQAATPGTGYPRCTRVPCARRSTSSEARSRLRQFVYRVLDLQVHELSVIVAISHHGIPMQTHVGRPILGLQDQRL